jgi:alkylated DNA nucleotide flippase Atl1
MIATAGTIRYLFQSPQQACATAACEAGWGLTGNVHGHRLSPRQILVTLESELSELGIAPGALYENMVIALAAPELFRPGSALITSSGVEIRLTMYCEPCKRILPIVQSLAKMVHRRGVLGSVVKGGRLEIGDQLHIIGNRYAPLPESAFQKFLDFVPLIPHGRVVRYSDVTMALGVADSFVRALPGYIKRSLGLGLPVHRIVSAKGGLLDFLPGQAQLLADEGVITSGQGKVDLAACLWQG